MARLSIELTEKEHQIIKAMAALKGKSLREFTLEKLFAGEKPIVWERDDGVVRVASKSLAKAVREAEAGKLKPIKDLDAFFRQFQ